MVAGDTVKVHASGTKETDRSATKVQPHSVNINIINENNSGNNRHSPSVIDLEGLMFQKQREATNTNNTQPTQQNMNDSLFVGGTKENSTFNPYMMRGSLNVVARKQEMKRINEGNRVSFIE